MNNLVRFSFSGLIAIAVTCVLFLGMQALLGNQKSYNSGETPNINFGFVKNFKEPVEKQQIKKPIPVPKEATQPPAAPSLPVTRDTDSDIYLPQGVKTKADWKIITDIPMTKFGVPNGMPNGQEGALRAGMAPMYPPAMLMRNVEGWVEVLITVNEMGKVSHIEVLDAQPKREFDQAAIKAVRKWSFHPKKVDGKAVPFKVIQKVEFNIDTIEE